MAASIASPRSVDQMLDVEIVMELFRVARNRQLTTGKQVLAAGRELFADLSEDRLRVCINKLADMIESQG